MYFSNCNTVNEIKAEWRKLCHKHHPDTLSKTADVEVMKQVNIQYHEALSAAHGQTSKGTDNQEHTYYYNQETEQVIIDKINELLSLKMAGVEITLVGTWVWVEGETKPHKSKLGKAGVGLKWHGKRKMWFWSPPGSSKRRYSRKATFDDLKETYGAKSYKQKGMPALA